MKKLLIFLSIVLTLSINSLYGQDAIIEIEGSIIIGDNDNAQPAVGAIRYSGTDFEGWNGTEWLSFTGPIGASSLLYQDELYPIVKIGNQTWFGQNLRATRYNNNVFIERIIESAYWAGTNNHGYCGYNNDDFRQDPYGFLYSFGIVSVDNPNNVCPVGWHVPTQSDWEELIEYSGTLISAGNNLKQAGSRIWALSSDSVTNNTLFTALPGGLRASDGSFSNLITLGVYWASETIDNSSDARAYGFQHNDASVVPLGLDQSTGVSVRCIKD